MNIDTRGALRGSSTLERGRALGASPLTIRIYQAVLDRPGATAKEIHQWIRDRVGTAYDTDVRIWMANTLTSLGKSRYSDIDRAGVARVRERIEGLVARGILASDGFQSQGRIEAHYTAGRSPKGFRSHKALRPWGWHDVDLKGAEAWREQTIDRVTFLERARKELAKKKIDNGRELLTEAVRLLS